MYRNCFIGLNTCSVFRTICMWLFQWFMLLLVHNLHCCPFSSLKLLCFVYKYSQDYKGFLQLHQLLCIFTLFKVQLIHHHVGVCVHVFFFDLSEHMRNIWKCSSFLVHQWPQCVKRIYHTDSATKHNGQVFFHLKV